MLMSTTTTPPLSPFPASLPLAPCFPHLLLRLIRFPFLLFFCFVCHHPPTQVIATLKHFDANSLEDSDGFTRVRSPHQRFRKNSFFPSHSTTLTSTSAATCSKTTTGQPFVPPPKSAQVVNPCKENKREEECVENRLWFNCEKYQ